MSLPPTSFTPISALIGGVLIGLAALMLLRANGRIAGISGILGQFIFSVDKAERWWRAFFLLGLFLGGFLIYFFNWVSFPDNFPLGTMQLALAGLLVGVGTRLGSGCTSGHGVCGMSRLSVRSIVATLIFMATGFITVFLVF